MRNRKWIKLILPILITLMLFFCLTACSPNGKQSQNDEDTTENIQTDNVEKNTDTDQLSNFEKKSIKTADTDNFNYWLYTPKNATDNMPLIIYLHGGSGKGDDLDIVIENGFPKFLKNGELGEISAYIAIPQVSSSFRGWSELKQSVKSLIDYAKINYKIDEHKVSLTGHSMGGTGTWSIAAAFPTLFCRIMPLSGSVQNTPTNIKALGNISIWAFVGSADTIVDPQTSIDFVGALSSQGKNARVTILSEATHFDVPELVYLSKEYKAIDWLING